MSGATVELIIQRAVGDAAFRRRLQTDPHRALRAYGLTAEEIEALAAADPERLADMGVDQRISKAFTAGLAVDDL